MSHRHLHLLLPVVTLLACQGGELPAPGPGTPGTRAGNAVPLTRFRDDSFAYSLSSGVTSAQQLVIRDPVAWSSLWQQIHATETPVPPLPDVDFAREMIVAASLGTRSSGGYDVLLAGAVEDSTGLEISVTETSPGSTCVTTQALTQPIDLARTARRDGPVRFTTSRRVAACGI